MDEPNEIGEKMEIRDEKGRFVEGHPDLGAGRPKGSISIKEKIRKRLMDNPEALEDIITYFVKDSRELMWQMLEGKPQQDVNLEGSLRTVQLTRGDTGLIQESVSSVASTDNTGVGEESV